MRAEAFARGAEALATWWMKCGRRLCGASVWPLLAAWSLSCLPEISLGRTSCAIVCWVTVAPNAICLYCRAQPSVHSPSRKQLVQCLALGDHAMLCELVTGCGDSTRLVFSAGEYDSPTSTWSQGRLVADGVTGMDLCAGLSACRLVEGGSETRPHLSLWLGRALVVCVTLAILLAARSCLYLGGARVWVGVALRWRGLRVALCSVGFDLGHAALSFRTL